MSKRRYLPYLAVAAVTLSLLQLNGCAVAVVGAGAATAKIASDRRTVGTQLDDQSAETQVSYRWSKNGVFDEVARLRVDVHNGVALLTGQVPDASLQQQAEKALKGIEHIHTVHNQIRIASLADAGAQAKDMWLATKIRTKFAANEDVPLLHIRVIVEAGEAFLMGRLTQAESIKAVEIARHVDGVKKVVRAFEIIPLA